MAFELVRLLGGQEVYEEPPQAAVNIARGSVIYGASGYATNATVGNIKTHNVIGVSDDDVDNSGGAAGDTDISCQVSPLGVYTVGTTGTAAQSQVFTNVTLETVLTIDEDDSSNTDTGLCFIRKFISTSKVEVSINFASPADA